MDENEEFEFRARAEREGAAPVQQAPQPSGLMDRIANSDIAAFVQHPVRGVQEAFQYPQQFYKNAMQGIAGVGRGAVDASIGIPGMVADAVYGAKNLIAGTNDPLPTQVLNQRLDQVTGPTSGPIRPVVGMMLGSRIPLPGVKDPAQQPIAEQAPSRLTGAQQQAAESGQELGMRLTPGQKSGSVPLQQIEAKLESHPWTAGPFAKIKEGNQAILNRSWAGAIGENSDTVDSTVLGRAVDRIGEVFDKVGDPAAVRAVDPEKVTANLAKIDDNFAGLLPNNESITANPLVKQFQTLSDSGAINGQQLQQLSSKLGKAAAKQRMTPSGDRDLGEALYQVKNHVDDLIQEGLSGEDQGAFAAARSEYRNLMLLTRRAPNVNPSTGNVSARSVASTLQSADRSGFLYGRNASDAYNATRFGQAFGPSIGNSGTATRQLGLGDMLSAIWGIPANVGTRAYLSRPGQSAVQGIQALSRYSLPEEVFSGSAPLLLSGSGGQ